MARHSSFQSALLQRTELIPTTVFLLVLPFNHTVALRLTALSAAAVGVLLTWRRDALPALRSSIPILAWAVLAAASVSWSIDFDYPVGEIKNEVGYTMTAFLVFYALTRERSIWNFWNAVLVASFATMTAIAIWGYVLAGHDSWTQSGLQGGVGTFSTYVVIVFPFLFATALRESHGNLASRQLWLILPILVFCVAGLTANRAVWPALMAQLAIFAVFAVRHGVSAARRRVVVVALVMAAIALLQFVAAVKYKAPPNVATVDALVSLGEHDVRPMQLWTLAWQRVQDRPALGYGFGRGILRKDISESRMLWHAHNLLLDYALQLGIAGVVVIAAVFVSLAREFWKLTRLADAELRLIGVAGVALLAGVLLKNMTDDFFVRESALLFWTLVGMSLGYAKRAVHRAERGRSQPQTT